MILNNPNSIAINIIANSNGNGFLPVFNINLLFALPIYKNDKIVDIIDDPIINGNKYFINLNKK